MHHSPSSSHMPCPNPPPTARFLGKLLLDTSLAAINIQQYSENQFWTFGELIVPLLQSSFVEEVAVSEPVRFRAAFGTFCILRSRSPSPGQNTKKMMHRKCISDDSKTRTCRFRTFQKPVSDVCTSPHSRPIHHTPPLPH